MGMPMVRDRLIEEIQLIPEEKLAEIFDLLHYFRLGLQRPRVGAEAILKFAGSWKLEGDARGIVSRIFR